MSEPFALTVVLAQDIKVKIAKARTNLDALERVMGHLSHEILERIDKNMDTVLDDTVWAPALEEATTTRTTTREEEEK